MDYMSKQFTDFLFVGSHSNFYAFRRENECEIYDYIIIQKEFLKEYFLLSLQKLQVVTTKIIEQYLIYCRL